LMLRIPDFRPDIGIVTVLLTPLFDD